MSGTGIYIDGLTMGREYRVSVTAEDASANASVPSEERSAVITDGNDPSAPSNVHTTTGGDRTIVVTWNPVQTNSPPRDGPSGDPAHPQIRDLEGYRIYRGDSDDFDVGDPTTMLVAGEATLHPTLAPAYTDVDAVACRTYYYLVRSWDLCDHNNDTGDEVPGRAVAVAPPAAPAGVAAVPSTTGVRVAWEPVGRDEEGGPSYADTYHVYRDVLAVGELPGDCGPLNFIGTASGTTSYLDSSPPAVSGGSHLAYRVRATNDCASNNLSACSAPVAVPATCTFDGRVVISSPKGGTVGGPVPVAVTTADGMDSCVSATLDFRREEDGTVQQVTIPTPGPFWGHTWTPPGTGTYVIKATVRNASGCTSFAAVRVHAGS